MSLSSTAREQVARLAAHTRGGNLVSVADAIDVLGMNPTSASRRLRALARAGWLTRRMRGLYEIRPIDAVASARLAVEDPWVMAMKLWSSSYIGGWSAAGHWGFTEQLFRSTFVVTTESVRHTERSVGGANFRVAHRTWHGTTGLARIWRSGSPVNVATAERTVIDACEHPSWVGGGRMLADIVREAVEGTSISFERLNGELRNGISGAGAGRLGFLIERLAPHSVELLAKLRALRKTGYVRLDPAVSTTGRLATRWGVWVNVSLDSSDS